ncbi:hypothetical protein J4Q44_G00120940 [Coregonus suidteri]|uniref:G-protein coupled receptors family 1 profile domain-containing protein n=1 Tax=Coregonus suidteri TaxID=861788 RepID=A0AAN8LUD5_9TELE
MLCDDSLSAAAMSNQFKNTSSSTWDIQEGGNSTPPPSFQFELEPVAISVNPWDIVLCVTGTLMSCENAIVLALIIYTPTLKAPMFVLIGSLAFADLLAGLGLIVNFTITYIFDTGFVTLLSAGLLITAFSASVLNILAITVDRYLSLYNALTYHTERTAIFTIVTLVLIWVTSITLGALPIMGWNCLEDETTCSICAPIDKNHAAALAWGPGSMHPGTDGGSVTAAVCDATAFEDKQDPTTAICICLV